MTIDEIRFDTPLENILDHTKVEEITDQVGRVSPIMKKIYNRATLLDKHMGEDSGLGVVQLVNSESTYHNVANQIYGAYDSLFSTLPQIVETINLRSSEVEYLELTKLAEKLNERISDCQGIIDELDRTDDHCDEAETMRGIQKGMIGEYNAKLEKVNARLSTVSHVSTSPGVVNANTPAKFISTGSDDNNVAYGADGSVIDNTILGNLTSGAYRGNWEKGEGRIGPNGDIIHEGDPNYELYNDYFTCKITCKDGTERVVYMISPSSGYGTNDEYSLQHDASPILYFTQDGEGHTLCFDKSGNAVSYNAAMNIMEVSRCSNPKAQGRINVYNNERDTATAPSAFSPTYNYSQQGYDDDTETTRSWSRSEEDANGNRWTSYSTKTFDDSETFESVDISRTGWYEVYTKDNGDMGRINVLLDIYHEGERYYSIKQPDGTFLYYDSSCNPITAEEILRRHIVT